MLTGRFVLAVAFVVAAVGAAVVWIVDRSEALWVEMWVRAGGVPVLLPTFADLRAYTTAWECDRAGIDVFVSNTCDPWAGCWSHLVFPRSSASSG